ncbi:MAG: transposase [Opitutales bacterium]|nr:transposase [Opitutales bacterium]
MGEIRLKSNKVSVYHLVARVVQRRRLLADVQREVWVGALHRAAAFSGVELITYCCLQNHFHILVRIDPAAKECDDAELVRRFRVLYGSAKAMWCGLDASGLVHALAHDPPETAERLRERLRARMGDVSEFMSTLRQRYTMWFNKTYDTVGTLWAERFTSVLIEDTPWLVGLVAAYIDLSPVRAGLAALPEDYRWSGYAEAMAGHEGLRAALANCHPQAGGVSAALARYRILMLGKGAAAKRDGTGARVDPEALADALRQGGDLAPHELLRLKLRFFSRGLALGSSEWMTTGAGARALGRMSKPPGATPLEVFDGTDTAVARRKYRTGGAEVPRREAESSEY